MIRVNSVRSVMKKVALVACLAFVPSMASAAVYYPTGSASGDNDLQDLDHGYYYTWVITNLQPIAANATIDSASITFKNLYNWNNLANILHIDLLDTGLTTAGTNVQADGSSYKNNADGSRSYLRRGDDPAANQSNPTGAEIRNDAFDSANPLVASGTSKIDLEDRSFVMNGYSPTSSTALNSITNSLLGKGFTSTEIGTTSDATGNSLLSLAGWTVGASYSGGGYDYTYTFSSAERNSLLAFINNGNNVALGFDPDCHFYNEGISFQFTTAAQVVNTAVPEPASLLMLGTGLVAAGRYRRKQKSK